MQTLPTQPAATPGTVEELFRVATGRFLNSLRGWNLRNSLRLLNACRLMLRERRELGEVDLMRHERFNRPANAGVMRDFLTFYNHAMAIAETLPALLQTRGASKANAAALVRELGEELAKRIESAPDTAFDLRVGGVAGPVVMVTNYPDMDDLGWAKERPTVAGAAARIGEVQPESLPPYPAGPDGTTAEDQEDYNAAIQGTGKPHDPPEGEI